MSNISDEVVERTNSTYVYVHAFCDEIQRAGVQNVVICPGSRSTPLAISLAEHTAMRSWMHVDERSAAFFALGMARRLRQPVALLCTSGTAAANFFPAIVEAKLSHIPLLVLTADRPGELRDCGAPQAIEQTRLYGNHVKWFMDVALPEASNVALRSIRTLANRATALTLAVPAGPVHLNFPFREPLTPEPHSDQPLPALAQRDPIAWSGRPGQACYVQVDDTPLAAPAAALVAQIVTQVRSSPHGLIIVGALDNPDLTTSLVALAQSLGYPILADPLSQLRCGAHDQSQILTAYDAFLRNDAFVAQTEPQLILRFGAMPTAKPVLLYLKQYAHCPQVVIDGQGGWDEPTQLAAQLLHADPTAYCKALLEALGTYTRSEEEHAWLKHWQRTEQLTRQVLQTSLQDFQTLFEGRVFTELNELLAAGATLFVGNSMPIRDLDTFFWNNTRPMRIVGNRGANGIDGVVSTALGVSAVANKDEPVILVIGDLSFFHDLNGLLAARLHQLNLTVVLVNNDGGGIFSFLPQADYPEHFEQLFGTPTGLNFQLVVEMYGGHFQRIESWEQFRQSVRQGITNRGLQVIELQTERSSNVRMHRQLWQAMTQALAIQK